MSEPAKTTVTKGSFFNPQGLGVQVSYLVPWKVIANMMVSFVESGDPVSTASLGGWCAGFRQGQADGEEPEVPPDGEDPWYAHEEFWSKGWWKIVVTEVVDEGTGETKDHVLEPHHFARALSLLAAYNDRGDYRWAFEYIRKDSIDAPTADMFMQMACFGKEKYA